MPKSRSSTRRRKDRQQRAMVDFMKSQPRAHLLVMGMPVALRPDAFPYLPESQKQQLVEAYKNRSA